MTEVIAILALALLFVLFGLFVRAGHGCSGPENCTQSDGRTGCGGCPVQALSDGDLSTEFNDA